MSYFSENINNMGIWWMAVEKSILHSCNFLAKMVHLNPRSCYSTLNDEKQRELSDLIFEKLLQSFKFHFNIIFAFFQDPREVFVHCKKFNSLHSLQVAYV